MVQPLSFVIFLMGGVELVSATSASADTSPVERKHALVMCGHYSVDAGVCIHVDLPACVLSSV